MIQNNMLHLFPNPVTNELSIDLSKWEGGVFGAAHQCSGAGCLGATSPRHRNHRRFRPLHVASMRSRYGVLRRASVEWLS